MICIHKKIAQGFFLSALAGISSNCYAGIIFEFAETDGNVVMTSSGSFDTAGMLPGQSVLWGGTGFGHSRGYARVGSTNSALELDTNFLFNAGTDFSQFSAAIGPWGEADFILASLRASADITAGSKSFATVSGDAANQTNSPGLSVVGSDMVGTTWAPDMEWTWVGQSFASLVMNNSGTYSISDAVTGESITIRIVPAPSALGLIGLGLGVTSARRRRC